MPPTDCPTNEQLLALARGFSPEAEEEELLAHLDDCQSCRDALDLAFRPNHEVENASPPLLDPKSIVDDPAYRRAVAEIEHLGGPEAVRRPASASQRSRQELIGKYVGRYEILDQLGEGGMGVVYAARDPRLKRRVALKMTLVNRSDQDAVARFRTEAETVARLTHPNIVQIYEVGEHEGLPYLALELVEGGSLAKHAKGDPLPAREAAGIVVALGRAVDYAHQHGVVHRDLKPGNILVSSPVDSTADALSAKGTDSTRRTSATNPSLSGSAASHSSTAAGQQLGPVPKITDFGLAKNLDADSELTRSGTILGTPSYMAPEQARGDVRQVGPAADIYSLGAILYALVTGRAPFVGESYVQTISMVTDQEPLPPTRLQPRLPKDVETICLKCLEKQPGKRYATAAALADDLQHYLNREPILARPIGWIGRAAKFVRRRPALAAVVALVTAILLIGVPTITALYVNSEFHRRAAVASKAEETAARSQAQESEQIARQQVARLRAARGVELMNEGRFFESLVWTSAALEDEAQLRSESSELADNAEQIQRFRFAATLQQCPALVAAWELPETPVWQPAWQELAENFCFSPDGQFVCLRGLGMPGEPRRWRARDGAAVPPVLAHESPESDESGEQVILRRATRDGRLEAVAHQDFRVKVWDVAAGKLLHEFDIPKQDLEIPAEKKLETCHLEFSPDHRFLVVAFQRKPVVRFVPAAAGLIWDLESGQQRWPGDTRAFADGTFNVGPTPDIQFARGGERIFLGRTTLWDAQTGQVTRWPLQFEHRPFQSLLSPDARWIAYEYLYHPQGSPGPRRLPDATIEILDTKTRQFRSLEPRHNSLIWQFAFDPTGRWFLAGDVDGNVQVWDTSTWRMQCALRHRGRVWKVTFSPDGRWIVLATRGNSVRVWDVDRGQPVTPSLPHSEVVRGAAWGPDGRRLAVMGMNGAVRIWDLARQAEPAKTLDHEWPLNVVRFSPDDRLLATGCADTAAHVWMVDSGQQTIGSPMQHEEQVVSLSWDRTGKQLATINGPSSFGLSGNAVQVWNPSTGQAITAVTSREIGAGFGVGRAQFSPTANHLVIQYVGDANIDDLTNRRQVSRIRHSGPGGSLFGELHFSNDGRRLFTVKGTVCVWDMPSGKLLRYFEVDGMTNAIHSANDVDLSRNGRYFAIGATPGLIVLEVPDDPQQMRTMILRPEVGPVGLVSFDRAERRLLAVDINGVCRIWDLRSAEPVGPPWETGGRCRFAGFGPNDQWVVTVLRTGEVQLWDPETGQPLCPPRRHGTRVNDAALSHGGFLLATAGADGAVRIWDLRLAESHSPEQISQLARLLGVQRLSGDVLAPLDEAELNSFDLDRARREFPAMFSVSSDEVARWHLRQAADCRIRNQPDAAEFHLDRSRKRTE